MRPACCRELIAICGVPALLCIPVHRFCQEGTTQHAQHTHVHLLSCSRCLLCQTPNCDLADQEKLQHPQGTPGHCPTKHLDTRHPAGVPVPPSLSASMSKNAQRCDDGRGHPSHKVGEAGLRRRAPGAPAEWRSHQCAVWWRGSVGWTPVPHSARSKLYHPSYPLQAGVASPSSPQHDATKAEHLAPTTANAIPSQAPRGPSPVQQQQQQQVQQQPRSFSTDDPMHSWGEKWTFSHA